MEMVRAPAIDRESFMTLVRWRRSIRLFDPAGQVTDEQMNYILEAGRWSPSGGNYQPWHYLVVRDRATIEAIGQIYLDLAKIRREMEMQFPTPGYQFVKTVPVILVVMGDPRSMMMFPRMPEDPAADREYQRAAFNIYLMSMAPPCRTCNWRPPPWASAAPTSPPWASPPTRTACAGC
jgi:nitroreductase